MLAVSRGLLARPEILLLDEPSLGLAPAIAAELFGQFRTLREEGVTLLIVDQMAEHVLGLADRAYVLGGGRVVAQGTAANMRGKVLDDTYLGARPGTVN
jgi:ABC-type branched-subunit amino acid transport system ATPase component